MERPRVSESVHGCTRQASEPAWKKHTRCVRLEGKTCSRRLRPSSSGRSFFMPKYLCYKELGINHNLISVPSCWNGRSKLSGLISISVTILVTILVKIVVKPLFLFCIQIGGGMRQFYLFKNKSGYYNAVLIDSVSGLKGQSAP